MTTPSRTHADVIVVGAGLAGLTAALALRDAGRSVLVLEAADRVGGRVAGGVTADGQWLEFGGQWVAEAHTELRGLVDRFGLRLLSAATPGRALTLRGGGVDADSPLKPADRAAVDDAIARFGAIVSHVDDAQPWRTPEATELDEQTFATWIRTTLPSYPARRHFTAVCAAIFAPDPREVSLLHAAFYFRSTERIGALRGADRDAQEWRVDGGPTALCEAAAAELADVVHLGSAARVITQGTTVEVVDRHGLVRTADRVIVTAPPPTAARLDYRPPLPSAHDQLAQRLHSIAVVKAHLVYPSPFWREAGLSGEATIEDEPITSVLDNTPPGYPGGVLVGFFESADALPWRLDSPAKRRAAFIALATRLFGAAAGHPTEYLERDWGSDEFTRGCYSGHFPPATWTRYGPALTDPVGRIHWAGTETSRQWTGYMEGAVRSGQRAARETMDADTPRG